MITIVHEDEWVELTFDRLTGLLRYERTERPYTTDAEQQNSYAAIAVAGARIPPGVKLLIDVRRAPARNDAAFEARVNAALAQFTARFAKHALLVRTVVGRLQVNRLAAERAVEAHVFTDEAAALAYLGVAP